MKKYYSLTKNKAKNEADLTIFGDITNYPWCENDVSSYNLSKQLQELSDVNTINVHINSYGGEVAEGLAIYNALKNHKAKVKTYCDGFACSIASVIFMAGDERIMSNASLLMIHNAWSFAEGNASELRKTADDLDKITEASINAYMNHVNISREELKILLDNETWLDYKEAIEKGFATSYSQNKDSENASQNVKQSLIKMIIENQSQKGITTSGYCYVDGLTIQSTENDEEGGETMKYECQECGYIHEGELPEYFVCPECGASKDQLIEVEETEEPTEAVDEEETETEDVDESDGGTSETEEEDQKDEDKVINEKAITFFNAIAK